VAALRKGIEKLAEARIGVLAQKMDLVLEELKRLNKTADEILRILKGGGKGAH